MKANKVVTLTFSEDEYTTFRAFRDDFDDFATHLREDARDNDIELLCTDTDVSSEEINQEEYNLEDLLTAIEDRLEILRLYILNNS